MLTRHDSDAPLVTSAHRKILEVYDFIAGIAGVGPDVDRAYVSGFRFTLQQAAFEDAPPGTATLTLVLERENPETHERFKTSVNSDIDFPTVERILAFFDVTERPVVRLRFNVRHNEIAELAVTTYLSHKE